MKRLSDPRFAPLVVAVLVYLMLLLQVIVASRAYNEGHFGYALDDPYIHLALAKHLAQGHYGLNVGEVCAPSSSILWPFLLVPGYWLGISLWLPLILNVLSGVGALWIAFQILSVALRHTSDTRRSVAVAVLLVGFLFAVNLVGLTMTGMEHTLHLALSLAALWGLARERLDNKAPAWLALVLGLIPLLRYEGLALSMGAILYLVIRRRYTVALTAAVLALLPLAVFTGFLASHNLGLLPNSIAAKSRTHSGRPFWEVLWRNFQMNTTLPEAVQLVVLTTLVFQGARRNTWRGPMLIAGATGGLHLFMGSIGWFGRYEPYAVATLLGALALHYGRALGRARPAVLGAGMAALSLLYLPPTLESAEATNDIYLQQYQMQRLAQLWDGPVAVNDIGWVALTSKHYVLDLYGLANREALQRERKEALEVWASDLTVRHEVKLAMLYEAWFPTPAMPKTWVRVGSLELGRPKIVVGSNSVTLWATDATAAERLRALLPAFAKALPAQASIRLTDGTTLSREGTALPELASR